MYCNVKCKSLKRHIRPKIVFIICTTQIARLELIGHKDILTMNDSCSFRLMNTKKIMS